MFYTSKSIRLVSKLQGYLDLIQQANNRYEDKRATLVRFDASKAYHPLRLMYERMEIVEQREKWFKLSNWLVIRYQDVFNELGSENIKQLNKVINEMENTYERI